jgi:RNA polymerase sigma-70 factor, ECF subfamily
MTEAAHDQGLTAARGDDEALAILVRAYHDRVYRFGIRVCRDGYDADDAVQEAFAKLIKRPDVVRHPGALSWLMSVVRNACLRMLRPFLKERRWGQEPAVAADEVVDPQLGPLQALARWQLVQTVHQAIATLERPYREVLVLRDIEGLTGDETCEALGLEPATMKTRLHRARAKLRREIERLGAPVTGGN